MGETDDRRPLPPEVLAGALQDRVHTLDGRARPAESVRVRGETDDRLERAVLGIIAYGRSRCGAGFGKYPLGVKDAVEALLPLVQESARVQAAWADFLARLERD